MHRTVAGPKATAETLSKPLGLKGILEASIACVGVAPNHVGLQGEGFGSSDAYAVHRWIAIEALAVQVGSTLGRRLSGVERSSGTVQIESQT